ncbi:MAG: hypothetical protein AAGI72_23495 [Pseudomonadota bacterium]
MEVIPAFLLGVLVSPWFFGGAMLLLLISEYHESGWTYLLFVIAAASLMLLTGVRPQWWWLPTYPIVGLLWSFWRYRRFVAYRLEHRTKTVFGNERSVDDVVEECAINKNLDRAAYWILFWPTNMVVHATRDLWDLLIEFIKTKLAHLYQEIQDAEVEKYKAREEQ